jgi:hypothetical protein
VKFLGGLEVRPLNIFLGCVPPQAEKLVIILLA